MASVPLYDGRWCEGFQLEEGDVGATCVDGSGEGCVGSGVFVEWFTVHFECGEAVRGFVREDEGEM